MNLKMHVTKVDVDINRHMSQVQSDKLWTFAASEWHRLYDPWVPMLSGMLKDTVVITPGQIEHTVPYARYIYNGNFRFYKGLHARASRRWDKAAEPTQKPLLIQTLQAFIDGGGLGLDG